MSGENDPDREAVAVDAEYLVDRADEWKRGRRGLVKHTGGTVQLESGDWACVVSREGDVTQYTPSDFGDIPLAQHAGVMSVIAVAAQFTEDMFINAVIDEETENSEDVS